MGNRDEILSEVTRRAERVAARLAHAHAHDVAEDSAADAEYRALLDAVRGLDARFAFDLEGRPAAIDAVRQALPAMERDLFDAVLEDHTCELAAAREALYQLARACARRQ